MANNDHGGYFNPSAPHFFAELRVESMARWGDVTTHGASGERINLETSQELTRPEGLLAGAILDRSMVRVSRVSSLLPRDLCGKTWQKKTLIPVSTFWMMEKVGSVFVSFETPKFDVQFCVHITNVFVSAKLVDIFGMKLVSILCK